MKMNFFLRSLFVLMSFSVSQGVEFICSYGDHTWQFVGTVYTCHNAQVSLSGNPTTLQSVTGTHKSDKNNADVEALYVGRDSTNMKQLPKNIENFFPGLTTLHWWSGNLMSITANELRAFPKLMFLNLYTNKLTSLDGDLFKYTPRLTWAQFGYNQISNVGKGLLDNLVELQQFHFLNNPCLNYMAVGTSALQSLKNQLSEKCPPLITTTTPSSISIEDSCETEIRCSVNEEIDELTRKLLEQSRIIQQSEEKLLNLEKKMKETLASVAKFLSS